MRVLKFGGSSLATPTRVREVARIVLDEARTDPIIVVVSAFQGVTNQLIDCARLAEKGLAGGGYERPFAKVAQRHRAAVHALMGARRGAAARAEVDRLVAELHDVLHGIALLRHCPPRALDVVASFGERLSALIVAAFLNRSHPARFVDAREFVVTDDQFTQAGVIFSKTNRAARRLFGRMGRGIVRGGSSRRGTSRSFSRIIPVVTGFIGSTVDGQTTTIGRNGSDYTAAIVGAALGASVVEIWTDVDGVLSADPKAVPSAFVLPQITYEEAMELSYFGAKVLHSAAIAPAIAKRIPLLIKNSLNRGAPGTLIWAPRAAAARGIRVWAPRAAAARGIRVWAPRAAAARGIRVWAPRAAAAPPEHLAKGISSVGGLTLLTLRGLAMVGVPGIAERLFRALASHQINVILISQASSEHTICFAVSSADASRARDVISREYRFELQHGLTALDEKPHQAIIAIVGDGMKGRPGVAGRVFGALGRHNINISAIAQGASERNISCVVDSAQQTRALNVIHQAFFETRTTLALLVVGVGNIGGAFLRQVHQQHDYLRAHRFDLKVIGVANSRRFVLDPHGINLGRWREALAASRRPTDPRALARLIGSLELTNAALVDCTADAGVVDAYPDFLKADLHIITPNKQANVLPWQRYAALMELVRQRQKHFLYEANVGAGLPVVSTLRDLIASGDVIKRVEGIFSGTLSYLFNGFDGTRPFSALVREAHALGLTEPDPREDLSGQDVARKLLILARQTGSTMDIQDVGVESLVPPRARRGPFSFDALSAFSRQDEALAERLERARAGGTVLRYVGTLERGRARAGLQEFPRDHPFATTKGSDNVIVFTTKRYARTPLVVQGPGAGADVTAMGVFSDVLKLLHYLPQ